MSTTKKLTELWNLGIYQLTDTESDAEMDESCKIYSELNYFILQHNISNPNIKSLNVLINQRGGSVSAAHSVVQIIKSSLVPIHTYVMGQAASAATHIAVAGSRRFCFHDSLYMFHTYSYGSYGKFHDLMAERKYQDTLRQFEIDHYAKYSKLSKEDVANKLLKETDTWITAEEALEYGFVDAIVERLPITRAGNKDAKPTKKKKV